MNTSSIFEQLRSGVCTFMGFPLELEPADSQNPCGVVLGLPFDGGVIHRPGARLGPWAIRSASMGMGHWPMPLRTKNKESLDVPSCPKAWVDGGNLPTLPFSNEQALEVIETSLKPWLQKGYRTLILGGDHMGTLGALAAHAAQHGRLGLIHLDAHPDAAGPLWGTGPHHGNWLRTAILKGWVDPQRTVQLGVRAPRHGNEEMDFLAKQGVRMWTPLDLKDPNLNTQLLGDLNRVGNGPAYVSLDMDVLDPAFCPAVAEPVPGGLSTLEVMNLLQPLRRWACPWVGADVMEVAPALEGGDMSARAAAHLALQLLSMN